MNIKLKELIESISYISGIEIEYIENIGKDHIDVASSVDKKAIIRLRRDITNKDKETELEMIQKQLLYEIMCRGLENLKPLKPRIKSNI